MILLVPMAGSMETIGRVGFDLLALPASDKKKNDGCLAAHEGEEGVGGQSKGRGCIFSLWLFTQQQQQHTQAKEKYIYIYIGLPYVLVELGRAWCVR